jgi:hypothetical protein
MTGRRRFTIADGMILVSVLAVWCVFIRYFYKSSVYIRSPLHGEYAIHWAAYNSLLLWSSLALLILRVRKPRPSRFRLFCQPGFAACFAAVFCCLWRLFFYGVNGAISLSRLPANMPGQRRRAILSAIRRLADGSLSPEAVASGIVLIWLFLVLSRRWRAEPSWIDRAGRLVGVLWLVAAVGLWIEWYMRRR